MAAIFHGHCIYGYRNLTFCRSVSFTPVRLYLLHVLCASPFIGLAKGLGQALCYDRRTGGNSSTVTFKSPSESSFSRYLCTEEIAYAKLGSPLHTGSCEKLEVPEGDDEEQRVCVKYRCPFVPTSLQKTTSPAAPSSTSQPTWTIESTADNPFFPSAIPELLITYNFSNPQGPENEVYVNLQMSKSQAGPQGVRISRASHDIVSYTLDVWDELDPDVFFSFRNLMKEVRSFSPPNHLLMTLGRKHCALPMCMRSVDPVMQLEIHPLLPPPLGQSGCRGRHRTCGYCTKKLWKAMYLTDCHLQVDCGRFSMVYFSSYVGVDCWTS